MICNYFYRQLHKISVWLLIVSWAVLGIISGENAKFAENPVAKALAWPMGIEFFVRIWVALSVALLVSSEFSEESLKCVIVSGRKRSAFFLCEYVSTMISTFFFIFIGFIAGFLYSGGVYAAAFGKSYFLYEAEMFAVHFCITTVCFAIIVLVENKLLAALLGPIVLFAEMFADHILKTDFTEFYTNSPIKYFMPTGIAKMSYDLAFLGKADLKFFCFVLAASLIISLLAGSLALHLFKKQEC